MLRTQDKRLFLPDPLGEVVRGHRVNRTDTYGALTASSALTFVQSSGTNNKGSWVELSSGITADADGFYLMVAPGFGAVQNALVDIGIGASGFEVVLLENFLYSEDTGVTNVPHVYIPLPIPAGTRVAARCQSSDNNAGVGVGIQTVAGELPRRLRMSRATTYGANTADSGGTPATSGGANTKGAWAELSASTNSISYLILIPGNQNSAGVPTANILADVGVGAAASEVVVLANTYVRSTSNDIHLPSTFSVFLDIPAGSRLAWRLQAHLATQAFDIVAIGFGR